MNENSEKFILDACCGGRFFWFDKKHPNCLYIDIREEGPGTCEARPNFSVQPDKIMDFRNLDFSNGSFRLVVWDPPHIRQRNGKRGIIATKYGSLSPSWKEDLAKGFKECWRVLKDHGVLIFKWNESEIPLREILALFDETPLFGHPTGSKSKTHWLCFMKIPNGPKEKEE